MNALLTNHFVKGELSSLIDPCFLCCGCVWFVGERFHGGDGRSIRHPLSGQHSSAGSTMASSPISARSAPVPIHSSGGPAAPTGLSSSAPGHNTIMERPSSKPSSTKEPIVKPKDYHTGRGHQSDSTTANDHGTGTIVSKHS